MRVLRIATLIVGFALAACTPPSGPVVPTPTALPTTGAASPAGFEVNMAIILTCKKGEPQVTQKSLAQKVGDFQSALPTPIDIGEATRQPGGFCGLKITLPAGSRSVLFGNGSRNAVGKVKVGGWYMVTVGGEKINRSERNEGLAGRNKGDWALLIQIPGVAGTYLHVDGNGDYMFPERLL